MNRELTREEAISLHREMWADMQAKLGDNPSYNERVTFKEKWVEKYFPNEHVNSDCFLCEYAESVVGDSFTRCRSCPIAWNSDILPNCRSEVDYRYSPISVILALPEREGDGMSKIPVYLCNKKKCENGTCELCHYTTDINYAERNTNDEPIVAYDLDEDVVFVEAFKEVEK